MIKHCIAIHDLCGYSKSSLSVVIPVLEALGVEVWPLPTALLSTQTDGFDNLYMKDLTYELNKILDVWKNENIKADCIYSGFLAGAEQVKLVERVIKEQTIDNNPLIVIDPVLGDDLKLYSTVDESHVEAMRSLIKHADIIVPNSTEAAFLLNKEPKLKYSHDEAMEMVRALESLGPNKVIITSVNTDSSYITKSLYGDEAKQISTYFSSIDNITNEKIIDHLDIKKLENTYPGTGDLFASVVVGFILNGYSLSSACNEASSICVSAILATKMCGFEVSPNLVSPYKRSHGISVASIMGELYNRLHGEINKKLK